MQKKKQIITITMIKPNKINQLHLKLNFNKITKLFIFSRPKINYKYN